MSLKNYNFLILPFISIVNLQAQDYLVNFAGSGAVTTVTSVKVENLTQGTNLMMTGSNVLHLAANITRTESMSQNQNRRISFSPNPMTDFSYLKFELPESGKTIINLYDIAGRQIVHTTDLLSKGQHTYRIQGIEKGIYIVTIISNKYSICGRLVCSNSTNTGAKIVYESTTLVQEKEWLLKNINAETMMQYTTGDRLKLTGSSGNYSTVVSDIPTANKTITFNFLACTDGDGNNYPVIKIGTQTWMAENLKTTKYADGTPIPPVSDDLNWSALSVTSKAYCWLNDDINYKNTYGALYTWAAAMNGAASSSNWPSGVQGACPTGWNVPSDGDWGILEDYLILNGYNYDGTTVQPKLLGKALATNYGWYYTNGFDLGAVGNTNYPAKRNATGFSALPASRRTIAGTFLPLEMYAYWWTTTESTTANAYDRNISYYFPYIYKNDFSKASGYSVRCVKY
jgi:uncharacterized protein (TIGR02145 family)